MFSTKAMFKLLQSSITFSIISISCLPLCKTVVAQEYPGCFMINSSGQVSNLDSLCQMRRQVPTSVNACQGTFESNGFSTALSQEVAQLKAAIARAKQNNLDPNNDVAVQEITKLLVNQMPFRDKYLKLRQAVKLQSEQSQNISRPEAIKKFQEMQSIFSDLTKDPCFTQFQNALGNKGITIIPF
jgi:hypothetical protein